jgi:hypothetical protein
MLSSRETNAPLLFIISLIRRLQFERETLLLGEHIVKFADKLLLYNYYTVINIQCITVSLKSGEQFYYSCVVKLQI